MKRPPTLARKRLAYQRTFCGDTKAPHLDGQIILEDLRKIAKLHEGPIRGADGHADPYQQFYRDGMCFMLLRIQRFLGLDGSEVFDTSEESGNDTAST